MNRTDLTLSLQDMAELCIIIPSETATIIPVSKVRSAVKGMPRSFPKGHVKDVIKSIRTTDSTRRNGVAPHGLTIADELGSDKLCWEA